MFHLCFRPRRCLRLPLPRSFSSSSAKNPIEPPNDIVNPQYAPPQPPPSPIRREHLLVTKVPSYSYVSRYSVVALSATLLFAILAFFTILSSDANPNPDANNKNSDNNRKSYSPLYDAVEQVISKSNESFKRVSNHVGQTGIAVSVLWQSLRSVLSSANHEVRAGFELHVAALLAHIAAANAAHRTALVGARGGKVVDWLLETVASGRADGNRTQAEAASALAYLIADPLICKDVLAKPHALPCCGLYFHVSQRRRAYCFCRKIFGPWFK